MIRDFEPDMLDEVMSIWLETNLTAHHFIPGRYWRDNFSRVRSALPEARVIVHMEDGRITGFAGMTGNERIEGLFVSNGCQGRGIGRELLDECKKRSRRLELSVYSWNGRAVDFYMKNGFLIAGTGGNAETGEPELTMVWTERSVPAS